MNRQLIPSLIAVISSVLYGAGAGAAPITAGGPGGLDRTDLRLWLKADTLSLADGAAVANWADSSGKNNHASQGTADARPTFVSSVAHLNNLPAVQFNRNGTDFSPAGSDFMETANTVTLNGKESVFAVWDTGGYAMEYKTVLGGRWTDKYQIVTRFDGSNTPHSIGWTHGNNTVGQARIADIHRDYTSGATGQALIFSGVRDVTDGTANAVQVYVDGVLRGNTTHTTVGEAGSVKYMIGAMHRGFSDPNNRQQPFDGLLPEIITFNRRVNAAERIVIENYLSSKYNQPLSGNDRYAGDTAGNGHYDFAVFGIGQTSGQAVVTAGAAGFGIEIAGGLANGKWVFAGHKTPVNGLTDADIAGLGLLERWERVWYLDETNIADTDELILAFSFNDAGLGAPSRNRFALLYSPTNAFSFTTLDLPATFTSGDLVTFSLAGANLADGYYTLGIIPEPTTLALLGLSALGLLNRRRRRPSQARSRA